MEDEEELLSDEEEILVYVEFEDCADVNMLSGKQLHLDMLGLDTQHPIMQVNGRFFEGTFEDAIGTYMFFDKNQNAKVDDPVFDTVPTLEYFAKTKKLLKMQRVFVKHHTEVFGDSEHGDCIPNFKVLQEAGVPMLYQKEALSFWTEARNKRMNALKAYLEKQRIREEKKLLGIAMDSESDDDNPFAAYNPKNDVSKIGKSKVRKKEELEVEKSMEKSMQNKNIQEGIAETEHEVNVNNEQQELNTKLKNNEDSGNNGIEENEIICKKLEGLKGLELSEHSSESLNASNSKVTSEEENMSGLTVEKCLDTTTTQPEVFDNKMPQGLQSKVSSVKLLTRKNKISFPPSSLTKKRLKNKSSLVDAEKIISVKGNDDIAGDVIDKKDDPQCSEKKNIVIYEDELKDESGKMEELHKSQQRNEQKVPQHELNNEKIIVDQVMKDEKRQDSSWKDKNTGAEDNEKLQCQQGQGREEHKPCKDKFSKHEEQEVNVNMEEETITELTTEDKILTNISDKRLRKQEKRKKKLREITKLLKTMADNYNGPSTSV